jgi:hypothetical protein
MPEETETPKPEETETPKPVDVAGRHSNLACEFLDDDV